MRGLHSARHEESRNPYLLGASSDERSCVSAHEGEASLLELAFRESDGIEVALLWDAVETASSSTCATVEPASGWSLAWTARKPSKPSGTRSPTRRDDGAGPFGQFVQPLSRK
jgi:hypothetical protein